MKITCFYDFLRKNPFLRIFYTQNDYFSIFEGVLTLWHHSEVKSYINGWYLFWYHWEDVHTFTLVVNLGIWHSVLIIWRGVTTTSLLHPPSGNMFGNKKKKMLQRTRVNCVCAKCRSEGLNFQFQECMCPNLLWLILLFNLCKFFYNFWMKKSQKNKNARVGVEYQNKVYKLGKRGRSFYLKVFLLVKFHPHKNSCCSSGWTQFCETNNHYREIHYVRLSNLSIKCRRLGSQAKQLSSQLWKSMSLDQGQKLAKNFRYSKVISTVSMGMSNGEEQCLVVGRMYWVYF